MACPPGSRTTESKSTRKKLCVILEDSGFKFLYDVRCFETRNRNAYDLFFTIRKEV